MTVLFMLGVGYVLGAGVAAVVQGLSPFEFPQWSWPVQVFNYFRNK